MLTSRKLSVAAAVALAAGTLLVLAGCSSGSKAHQAGTGGAGATGGASVALVESAHDLGPWNRKLTLPLGRAGVPTQFYLCGVVGQPVSGLPCRARPGTSLPKGSTLHLEQHPAGAGVPVEGSPGWGLVGTGEAPALKIVLSDFVSANNKPKTVSYRVTERDAAGTITATSNVVSVTWRH